MTAYPSRSRTPLATNGDANELLEETSWLLNTPAPAATNPFRRVARPRIEDRSDWGRARLLEEEITQDSNAENRMDVETPPRTRPSKSTGSVGIRMHKQASV